MKIHKLSLLSISLCGLLIISIAHAQVYSWTDENEKIRFADDLSQVPEKYKKSAVRVGPVPRSPEQIKRDEEEYEKRLKEVEGSRPIQKEVDTSWEPPQPSAGTDLAEDLVRKGYATSYEWTQKESLWIKIPASTAPRKEEYSEMASTIAAHYHGKKGYLICVRFYYGSGKVIAYECR